jgi:hypothetical protein
VDKPQEAPHYRGSAADVSAAEAPPLDTGTAGASAQREHDRRAANREERVRERFGRRFGGAIIALVPEPQTTRAWAKGARGEQRLAEALAGLPDVVALHDRCVPGTRGNIDHLVIAPAGLFVVDAKHYEGRLRIRDKGGLFRTDNRLCFIDVDWPLLFAPSSFRGVRLEDPKTLRKLITATPALDASAIDKLARILAAGFPGK